MPPVRPRPTPLTPLHPLPAIPADGAIGVRAPGRAALAPSIALLAIAGLVAASAFMPGRHGVEDGAVTALGIAVLLVATLAAAVPIALLVTDRRVDALPKPSWHVLGAAASTLAIAWVGEMHWFDTRVQAVASACNVAFHALTFVAVAMLPCGLRTRMERIRLLFDVIVTAGAAMTLTLVFIPGSYRAAVYGAPFIPPVVGVVADAMLFATIAMLWLRGMVAELRDPLAPLAVACAVHVTVQCITGTTGAAPGLHALRVGSLLPLCLFGLAAVRHRAHLVHVGITCGTPRRLSLLPTFAAAAVLFTIVCMLAFGIQPTTMTMVSAALVGLAALVRQVLGLRDEIGVREQNALEQADRRLAALVRHGSDMLTILEADTEVRYASPSHLQVMGIPPEMLVGKRMNAEIHREDLPAAQLGFDRLLSGESMRESLVVRLRDGTGQWRWVEAVGTNLFNEPTVAGLVLNSRDITDRKLLEAQLLEQALRDPLTGLGNRRLFTDRVSHALETRLRRGSQVALLLLDLDHFKFVNDTLGHAKGDALLVAVSERLRNVLRAGDTVARLGGDEFAVLLEDLDTEAEADATAQRILGALDRPFALDEREVFVRASVGIAWATDGQDVDALLIDADVAMYGAKNSGRGRAERYSSEMRARVAERVDLEADLRWALERDELELFYQPLVDLETGCIDGAEALIRWNHPERGLVMPTRFIPVAEESDLINAIGRFVTRRAAQDTARFRSTCPAAAQLRVAVNISARHLLSPELVPDVMAALLDAGIAGSAMAVELTESVLASNEPIVAGRLQALRDLGLRIALDDFGTGYSSLAYLRRFPIDVLKVDKSFVSYGQPDASNDGVTKAIVSIGQSLGLRTVAEGVETLEQLDRLRQIGCALGQGYLFSRPITRDAFAELLRTWDPSRYASPVRLTTSGQFAVPTAP